MDWEFTSVLDELWDLPPEVRRWICHRRSASRIQKWREEDCAMPELLDTLRLNAEKLARSAGVAALAAGWSLEELEELYERHWAAADFESVRELFISYDLDQCIECEHCVPDDDDALRCRFYGEDMLVVCDKFEAKDD